MRPVNLVPQEQRRGQAAGRSGKGAYAVCAVLALALAMLAGYVVTSNQLTERENEAAALGAEADRLDAEAAARANYTDFADIAQQRLTSVAAVAETRFDWERLMREVSRVMPGGSWLQATDASVAGDPNAVTAAPTTPGAAAAPAGPFASFVGCTPDQSDVAQLMVRMRQFHRVEDVQLRESAQEAVEGAATVDNCGSLYKFDVAVTFSPIAPPEEAPRGSRGVPAALGGGS